MAEIVLNTGKAVFQGKRIVQANHLCVLYVIAADENGPSKIGITTDILTRVRSLQVGCWLPLRVYDFRLALPKNMPGLSFNLAELAGKGAAMAEMDTHAALTACDLRMVGEWFDVSPDEALEVIDKCSNLGGYRSISFEQVAGAATARGLDPEVHKSKNRLSGAMLKIKAMAASASREGVDLLAGL